MNEALEKTPQYQNAHKQVVNNGDVEGSRGSLSHENVDKAVQPEPKELPGGLLPVPPLAGMMDTTEQTLNGTAQPASPDPGTLDIFDYLNTLPKGLSEEKQRDHYRILLPSSVVLYKSDLSGFEFATKKVARRLKIKIRTILQDVKKLVPPALEEDLAGSSEQDNHGQRGPSQATQLVSLAADAELFHTPDVEGWATILANGHREHWPLKVKAFRRWLARRFYEQEKTAPGSQAVQDALNILEGKALFDGTENPVFTRIAERDGAIYLDLCNEKWEAIEITAKGWSVVSPPPVRFRRAKGMLALSYPVRGGSLNELRQFVNVAPDMNDTPSTDWVLLLAWLIAALRPRGPYPILPLSGEQGSAKSTLARILRSLVDPSSAPLRTMPREERDLMISAQAGWVLAFDNLSYLPQWLSDAFCRLATGGGFATRELYSDADEVIFDAQRPVILTGIGDVAVSPDILDRSIPLVLPAVPEDRRKQESTLWREFEEARPRILGALLDVVAAALRTLPTIKLHRLPRMADFAMWATAAELALGWESGTFIKAYTRKREASNDLALEVSPIAAVVKTLLDKNSWEGTSSELLTALGVLAGDKETKTQHWPKTPLALSNVLRRLAPNLRAAGIETTFVRAPGKRSRLIRMGMQSSDASDAGDAPREIAEDSASLTASLQGGASLESDGATQQNTRENKPCVDSVAKNPLILNPSSMECGRKSYERRARPSSPLPGTRG